VLLRTRLSLSFVTQITAPDADLHVPELCDLEFVSVLRGGLMRGRLSVPRAAEAVSDYRNLPLSRHRHEPLLERILELRDNFSVYDACYVALAEAIEATLVTADRRLATAVREHLPLAVVSYDL
jgi:predicted nucleic acid-binding protein